MTKSRQWFGFLFSVTLSLCFLIQACSPSVPESTKLLLTGSSTVAPLMTAIAERYQITHPDVVIEVQTGGSNKGVEDVRTGANDIGMASRALKPEEQDLTAFTVAQDGIALVVHQSNRIQTITPQQAVDIYTGNLSNWKTLGGDDSSITVLNKTANHATLELFAKHFKLEPESIVADRLVGDNTEMIETILENPSAIGYVSIGAAEYKIVNGIPLKMMSLEGVPATVQSVSKGIFPLSRPLNLITKEEPAGVKKEFIDFARSPAVEDIVQAQAFVQAQL